MLTKKKKKKAPAKRRALKRRHPLPLSPTGKLPRKDNTLYYPSVVKNERGEKVHLQPMYDAVDELFLDYTRGQIVARLTKQYRCVELTVDRAIAAVKDAYAEESALDRPKRMEKNYNRLMSVYKGAKRVDQNSAAVSAVREASKLMGDMKPDIILQSTADMESDQLQAIAEDLAKIAAKRSGTS